MTKHDLLVIGGGPAGATTAYWAAKAGMDVVLLEKKEFPRVKTCGDGLTPRSIKQLDDIGVLSKLSDKQRNKGIRIVAGKNTLEIDWPVHPDFPDYGLTVYRKELDELVLNAAKEQGVKIHHQTEATKPIFNSDSTLKGAIVKSVDPDLVEVEADYTIVCDGANSRFGWALGTKRERKWPQGMAIRTYYESPNHQDEWLEFDIGIRDKYDKALPGYGWVFPMGDGTINVGMLVLSTFKNYKEVNTTKLLEGWKNKIDNRWEVDVDNPCIVPVGGRIPMSGSISPKAGVNWMLAGDAAGVANPLSGEGIDYAFETGRHAAELLMKNKTDLTDEYPKLLEEKYGEYFRTTRVFSKIIGKPTILTGLLSMGMNSKRLMSWSVRIMANLLREDKKGAPELVYSSISNALKLSGSKSGLTPKIKK